MGCRQGPAPSRNFGGWGAGSRLVAASPHPSLVFVTRLLLCLCRLFSISLATFGGHRSPKTLKCRDTQGGRNLSGLPLRAGNVGSDPRSGTS